MSLRGSFLSRRISSRSSADSVVPESTNTTKNDTDLLIRAEKETEDADDEEERSGATSWATMPPELLGEIIQRVEAREDRWPFRRDVVVCGCVCRRWREVTKDVVRSARCGGKITFPSCLKQPGPDDSSLHCLIKRDKRNSTYYLFLSLSPSFTDNGKFLLAAKRYRNGAHLEYIISLDADDLSQGTNAYVGKLRSDFLGSSFNIDDGEPPYTGARPSSSKSGRRFSSKQISPEVPARNFEVGRLCYKFTLLKFSRGPRKMVCSLKSPWSESGSGNSGDERTEEVKPPTSGGTIILRNKAPRWHEHLQCWCLNFHGRVTVASVKNFQLVATNDEGQPGQRGDGETVILQFGKVGDDIFTMDFRQPLSAFQAFAICLTSFGTKLACE